MPEKLLSSLTIFFPCYDDRKTIVDLVLSADLAAAHLAQDHEILVVDDGSTDGSREALRSLEGSLPKFRLILHDGNRGYGAALRTGFAHATKEWIFYTDGDGQYDLGGLGQLAGQASAGFDVVNGYKLNRRDPWYRVLIGELYRRGTRFFFRLPIRDANCDFRLIRRQAVSRLDLRCTSGGVGVELISGLKRLGCRFSERGVEHHPRLHGRSRFFVPKHLLGTGLDLILLLRRNGC